MTGGGRARYLALVVLPPAALAVAGRGADQFATAILFLAYVVAWAGLLSGLRSRGRQ